tara:strand:- start:743 stop:1060 length:318 start_codon:yes stop_codon:yes gene_type:complete
VNVNQFETVSEAINYLISKGYSHNFEVTKDSARCIETDKKYAAKDLLIVAYHRFEGVSSASDMSALYVIECSDGIKGSMLDAYGTYANLEFGQFISKVPMRKNLS